MQMGRCTKVNDIIIKLRGKEIISILMEQNIVDNGKEIFNMEKEWKPGLMDLILKVLLFMVSKKDMVSLFGVMVQNIKEVYHKIILMGKVNIFGQIKDLMKVNEKTIKCMVKEFLNGKMEEYIQDNMNMI